MLVEAGSVRIKLLSVTMGARREPWVLLTRLRRLEWSVERLLGPRGSEGTSGWVASLLFITLSRSSLYWLSCLDRVF